MTIRRRIVSSRWISVGLALFLSVLFLADYSSEERVMRRRDVIETLGRTVAEIMVARADYIQRPSSRAIDQWEAARAEFDAALEAAGRLFTNAWERAELRRIRILGDENQRALELIPRGGNPEYIGHLGRNAMLNSYEILNVIGELRARIGKDQERKLRFSLFLAFLAVATVVGIVVLNGYVVQRSVERGMKTILAGLSEFEKGNAAHRIPVEEMDEIGTIGRAINGMASALARRSTQLEASNRELESFSYSISHDLRAPLRHLSGFSGLLGREYAGALDGKGRHYIEVITESAERMGRLIDGLLAFSRMGRAEMKVQPIECAEMVRAVIREVDAGASGRIEWVVGPLPAIHGDPMMILQVFVNLIDNAVKFSGKKDAPRVEIRAERTESGHLFSIRDNGAGFDPLYAGKLFGVFQRLHRSDEFEGTGIGLAIVRRVVSRHGGETRGEGCVGEGATFCFSVPDSSAERKS